eukprot:scaffold8311_cov63-Cyclotella_meneghiniana.AAC.1
MEIRVTYLALHFLNLIITSSAHKSISASSRESGANSSGGAFFEVTFYQPCNTRLEAKDVLISTSIT